MIKIIYKIQYLNYNLLYIILIEDNINKIEKIFKCIRSQKYNL